jgi:ATP-dependent Clp protease adaptor protein ClpS
MQATSETPMARENQFNFESDPDTQAQENTELRPPRMYRVLLHNDHFTTMEFVIDVLVAVFHKPAREARRIMLDVHRRGSGVCGVYSYDIARTKVARVLTLAREQEFPLQCTFEEA